MKEGFDIGEGSCSDDEVMRSMFISILNHICYLLLTVVTFSCLSFH